MPSSESGTTPRRAGPVEAVGSAHPTPGRGGSTKGAAAPGLAGVDRRRLLAPAGMDLYRHIARLVELGPEHEFMVMPCGAGATTRFLAETTGASGSGVEPDAELVEAATAAAREAGLSNRLHYEQAPPEDLPYKDEVFDVVIGEPALSATVDPAAAVRELARTTKPMGSVVLVQFIWTGNAGADRREAIVESLGVRPLLLVEWKQLLRDAGVVDLYVEDWSDSAASPRAFGALGRLGPLRERIALAYRSWRSGGWRGVRQALESGGDIRRLLLDERILGLSLIKGVKWQGSPTREE